MTRTMKDEIVGRKCTIKKQANDKSNTEETGDI